MSYALLRPGLFALEAETAHRLSLTSLRTLERLGLARAPVSPAGCRSTVMGLAFPNPVGLAAGLDKNGEFIDALACLGFGSIEIGTVTPRPQPGTARPRLFRLVRARALVNRMGFNNAGVEAVAANVRRSRWRGVLGINIGKNLDTPVERALDDYTMCLREVYALAGYVTVNVSSPNTAGLRGLQGQEPLDRLLGGLAAERSVLADRHGRRVPMALKIAPDLEAGAVAPIADLLVKHGIDAVIATNTTIARDGVAGLTHAEEPGGLSGAPLAERSTALVRAFAHALGGALPVIGVGGIMCATDAAAKIAAGASLVQLYTGLVYRGPRLVRQCVELLCGARLADRRA
jgi:dihydroorotate dehydrogenase